VGILNLRIAFSFEVLDKIKFEFPTHTSFENDNFKLLIEAYYSEFSENDSSISDSKLDSLLIELKDKDVSFESCFLQIHFKRKSYGYCIQIFESIPKELLIPYDIYIYITSLENLKTKNRELLYWLKYWRENFDYDPNFSQMELKKHEIISSWETCLDVAEYGYKNDPQEFFLLYICISAYNLDDKDTIEKYLEKIKGNLFKAPNIANQIIKILLHFNFLKEGVELCYLWAKEKDNKESRTIFFSVILYGKDWDSIFIKYQTIEKGHYVRYLVNNDLKVHQKIISNDDFSSLLIGQKNGVELEKKQNFGNKIDTIKVIGICNKFLALKLEIMDETDNPHSGLGMQSFKIDFDQNPLEQLLSILPKQEKQNDPFEEYYSEKITYSQLPWLSPELNRNLIFSYYKLIHEHKGLIKVGLQHFLKFPVIKDPSFILDFSSLPHFYELSKSGEFNPNVKFKISSYTKGLLKQYKEDKYSFRSTDKYIIDPKYYENLENWIEEYCDVISPISLLDMTAKKGAINEPMVMYLLNNSAILEEIENSILVTDDLTYYKIYPLEMNKIISTDFFLVYHQSLSRYSL